MKYLMRNLGLLVAFSLVCSVLLNAPALVYADEWYESGCEQPPAGSDDMGLYCLCRWSECMSECGGSGPSICKTQCGWERQLCSGGSGPWVN